MYDYWDSNWLNVIARMEANGAHVESKGSFLRNTEILEFRDELRTLHDKLKGSAELSGLEPDLRIKMEGDGLGGITVTVHLTPDHLNQDHRMSFAVDQTYLPPLISACDAILERYPVRGATDESR